MDELRPNLVGGLLGVAGLVDDVAHHTAHHDRGLALDMKPLHRSGKCSTGSSASEDFSALYGSLPSSGDGQSHQHTPTHTPPNVGRNINDHNSKSYRNY